MSGAGFAAKGRRGRKESEVCGLKSFRRKRHLLGDTLGLVLGVKVTPASPTERDGAKALLTGVLGGFT